MLYSHLRSDSNMVTNVDSGSNFNRIHVKAGANTVKVIEAYSGTIQLQSAYTILFDSINDNSLFNISNTGLITIGDQAYGQAIITNGENTYELHIYPTISNLAIESGYQDYKTVKLNETKYINNVKELLKISL